jgi:hypothetical protein
MSKDPLQGKDAFTCARCGQVKPIQKEGGTGYAYMPVGIGNDEWPVCYACCGEIDAEWMDTHDRISLYLTHDETHEQDTRLRKPSLPAKVSNWPGTLSYPVKQMKCGKHNIAAYRIDVWFYRQRKDNPAITEVWHGVQYGECTQIVHCRKLKRDTI